MENSIYKEGITKEIEVCSYLFAPVELRICQPIIKESKYTEKLKVIIPCRLGTKE